MINFRAGVYAAPSIADEILEFLNDASPVVFIENLDDAASAAIKFRESNNGVDWVDIAGTSATIDPGETHVVIVVAAQSRIALHAGGNVSLHVTVARQVEGSPSMMGPAA